MKEKEEEKKKGNQYKLNKATAIVIGLIIADLQLLRLCRFYLATMTEMPQIYSPSDFLELMSLLRRLAITIFCFPRILLSFLVSLLTLMQDSRVYSLILSESAPVRKGISISALSLPVNNIIINSFLMT